MTTAIDTHLQVPLVLQTVMAGSIPAGALGALYASIDGLRGEGAREDQRRIAERAAVGVVRMEWALRRRDEAAVDQLKEDFRALDAAWQAMPATCVA